MQPTAIPEVDPATIVVPPITHVVPWRVREVEALAGMRLRVTFLDDATGEVHMERFLTGPRVQGTIFEPLRDPKLFAQARVSYGTVCWPNGADLAPDTLYDEIREHSCWTPF